jgi:hypothetical protein
MKGKYVSVQGAGYTKVTGYPFVVFRLLLVQGAGYTKVTPA